MDLTSLLRFHIAPGGDPGGDPAAWQWENRTADVNHGDGITTTGGRADEVSEVSSGTATLEVDNAGGHYCTRNPLGRWYGRLARNCPARLGTISGAAAFATNAASSWGAPDVGDSWTLSGTASLWSVSSGMGRRSIAAANQSASALLNGADARNGDATFVASVPVVATGGPLIAGLVCRYVDASNFLLFTVEFGTSGSVVAKLRQVSDGVFTELNTSGSLGFTYTANERIKARCQWDGSELRMKAWEESGTEPTSWNVTSFDNEIAGSQVGLYLWRHSTNTNAGSVTLAVDALEVEAVEIVGTIPEFPIRWDPTATVSWAPLQIAGIVRRLSQGQPALRSPLYRQLVSRDVTGYWPLEDGSDATVAASAVPWNAAAIATNVRFAADSSLPGAEQVAQMVDQTSTVRGTVRRNPTSTGFAAMVCFKFTNLPAADGTLFQVYTTGPVARWRLMVTPTSFRLVGYNSADDIMFDTNVGIYTINPLNWVAVQLETEVVGANTTWAVLWHQVGTNSFYGTPGSVVGTVASHVRSFQLGGSVQLTDAYMGHLWVGADTLPFIADEFADASSGYTGETAAARIARLASEEGVLAVVEPGDSEPLGPQRVGTFLELLRAAEQADLGVLHEQGAGLGYRPRGARYNRPVTFALDIAAGDLSDPAPEPVDDDQRVRNDWTVTRDGGSWAPGRRPAHIAATGRYADSATINIKDDLRLPDHAAWRVHLGTQDELRWPSVTLNFTDRPDLLALWRGRPFGPRLTIANVPAQGRGESDPDLIVEGWTQRITSHSWTVELACSPAKPWDVGVYDDTSRLTDSMSTTLGTGRDSTQTSWTFSVSNSVDVWSTTATPYNVMVGGEELRVTSMGAVTGSGPYTQTATVVRAVNGVAKAHSAGAPIRIANPARKGL